VVLSKFNILRPLPELVWADEPRIIYGGALVSAPIDPSPISLIGASLCPPVPAPIFCSPGLPA
jgi:hypothetical protein